MRLLHTADWHLGKTFKGAPLIDDQKFIINQILDIIDREKIDALLIAGDVYDRAVPPVDAVDLFNDTLNRLAEKNLPTLIIAGNHDSAARLNFGSKLFASRNIYIAAKSDKPVQVVLRDVFGEVYFTLLPFAEPDELVATIEQLNIPRGRNVAVAHAFLTGGIESDSERKFVGGSANVDAKIFSDFDYVALGHLHRPQKISAENIRYAGSPLKYSFDEEKHQKSVTIVEFDAQGFVDAKKIPLTPRRDVRIVTGTLAELKDLPRTEDYICVRLLERVINPTDKLADVFPHLLSVEPFSAKNSSTDDAATTNRAGFSTSEYFADFFAEQTGENLSDDYRAAMDELFAKLARDDREA